MRELKGAFAAIVTPFTDDGMAVSEIRLARLVRRLVGEGVDGIAVCTQTGEFATMMAAERKSTLEIVIRESQGNVPVIMYVGMASTVGTVDLAQHCARHGAVAAIVAPPTQSRFSQREYDNHIRAVVQFAGVPIVVVDPDKKLARETIEGWQSLSGLNVAEPLRASDPVVEAGPTRGDEFRWNDVTVSALSMFPTAPLDALSSAMARYGRTRAAKVAFEALDFELGGPRAPMLPLTGTPRNEVMAIFA